MGGFMMSQSEVNRMKQELETINQALGFEPVFGWGDIWISLVYAAIGLGLAGWGGLGLIVQGLPTGRLIAVAMIFLIFSGLSLRRHQEKAKHPARWREVRVSVIAIAIVVPLLLIFMKWSMNQGSYLSIASTVIFAMGLAILVIAICDRNRLHYLGTAIPLMFMSIFVSTFAGNPPRTDLAVGLFFAASGVLTAAFMAWELRRKGNG
jgi:hypothetical protein